jgi:hypothetical protein
MPMFKRTLVQLQSGYTTEAAVCFDVLVIFLSTDNYESQYHTSITKLNDVYIEVGIIIRH